MVKVDVIEYLKRNLKPDPDIDLTDEILEYIAKLESENEELGLCIAEFERNRENWASFAELKRKQAEQWKQALCLMTDVVDELAFPWDDKNRLRKITKEIRQMTKETTNDK